MDTDSAANLLQHDPVLQTLLPDGHLVSQSSISRILKRVTEGTIDSFQVFNQALIDQARLVRNDTNMVIDLDSTHSDTFGNQEQTAYNAHYQTTGYHPLVAFDGLTGDFLKAKLRSGNQYTSNGVKEFLEPLLEHYNQIALRQISSFVAIVVSRHQLFMTCVSCTKTSMSFG